jgi:hypothetical protein
MSSFRAIRQRLPNGMAMSNQSMETGLNDGDSFLCLLEGVCRKVRIQFDGTAAQMLAIVVKLELSNMYRKLCQIDEKI